MSTLISLPGLQPAPDYQSLDRPLNFTAAAVKFSGRSGQGA
jgi:iron-sulfur cluster insertion protein